MAARWRLFAGMALASCGSVLAEQAVTTRPAVKLGRETTRIVGPLKADGTVD